MHRTPADERAVATHFQFGKNWERLIPQVDEVRIEAAARDLREFMQCPLTGMSFLDVGCGSGLSSLAAHRLGAASIVSIDIDPVNVANVERLKAAFRVPPEFPWRARVASIVSGEDAAGLPQSDVVYSWGVLHHTGDMWNGIRACIELVKPGGFLYLMIYRDAWLAPFWRRVKRTYTKGGSVTRFMLRNGFAAVLIGGMVLKGKNPLRIIREYGARSRGMSWYVDVTDWVGAYPFEWASAQDVVSFVSRHGLQLIRIRPPISRRPVGHRGTGSYQYLFQRSQLTGSTG